MLITAPNKELSKSYSSMITSTDRVPKEKSIYKEHY